MGALDHVVSIVSGEVSSSLSWAETGASAIMVSPLTSSWGGTTGAGAARVVASWGRPDNRLGRACVWGASRGQIMLDNVVNVINHCTGFNKIGGGGYCPSSGLYGSKIVEVAED